jgi:deoxyribodipyrimidine photo-lyase
LVKEQLQACDIEVRSFNGSLLWEPWDVLKKDGTPYKVFTPYYNKGCRNAEPPRKPLPGPKTLDLAQADADSCSLEDLKLLPGIRWDRKLENHWNIGETAAHAGLHRFLERGIINYKDKRNFPAQRNVSRLSPHLHWGEISPHQIWHSAACIGIGEDVEHFHRELGWREFSNYLLYHFPELPRKNFNPRFDRFPWADDTSLLTRWQRGETGIPIVDAGMRELWETGYMHNRVRMIVASFLTKNLLIHWQHGEAWFWDCLTDANLASNSASWQWVAGCGADAAPYFRIFNPVTQGQKFDPEGEYTRRFVPELDRMPDRFLFNPWEAPQDMLDCAGVVLGETYPYPVIDLKTSRDRALEAYAQIKG